MNGAGSGVVSEAMFLGDRAMMARYVARARDRERERAAHERDRPRQLPRLIGRVESLLMRLPSYLHDATPVEWDLWGKTNRFDNLGLLNRQDFETLAKPQTAQNDRDLELRRKQAYEDYLKIHDPLCILARGLRGMDNDGMGDQVAYRYFDVARRAPKGDVDFARFVGTRRPYVNDARAAKARGVENAVRLFGNAKKTAGKARKLVEKGGGPEAEQESLKLHTELEAAADRFTREYEEWMRDYGYAGGWGPTTEREKHGYRQMPTWFPTRREFPKQGLVDAGQKEANPDAGWRATLATMRSVPGESSV